jgi:hypothetical protein
MKIISFCALLGLTCPAWTLQTKPWFGNQYEFAFESAFTYYRFHRVEGASRQLHSPENTRVFTMDLGMTPYAQFDLQFEGEFAKSDHINWALRSAAMQGRVQFLDDISGDPVSLAFGLSIRGAPHHFLRDVGTPYASEFNLELTGSVGKEWSEEGMWTMRTYGFAAVGIANRGYPWTRELFVWQYNWHDAHRLSLFALSDVGFGGKQHVNVKRFNGWAKFQHQSIDLGITYGYKMGVYGTLSASYAYRIFAHNYPQHVNFLTLSYCIPFSLF